ncbi:hypothetical protein Tco_0235936, partial [Tanacetum coccineum]
VQRIENEAKTGHATWQATWTHMADTWQTREHTWQATWTLDPSIDLFVDWRSTTVDRWSGGGQRWSSTVDRHRPPLTVVGQR